MVVIAESAVNGLKRNLVHPHGVTGRRGAAQSQGGASTEGVFDVATVCAERRGTCGIRRIRRIALWRKEKLGGGERGEGRRVV